MVTVLKHLGASKWLIILLVLIKVIGWYGDYHYLLPWHRG